jgi:hypothetical protein
MVSDGKAGLAASDDDGVDPLRFVMSIHLLSPSTKFGFA